MLEIEVSDTSELIHPQLEEFIRESERNRIISIFAKSKKNYFETKEIISLICGFEVKEDD